MKPTPHIPTPHMTTEKLPSGEYRAYAQVANEVVEAKDFDELRALQLLQTTVRDRALGAR